MKIRSLKQRDGYFIEFIGSRDWGHYRVYNSKMQLIADCDLDEINSIIEEDRNDA